MKNWLKKMIVFSLAGTLLVGCGSNGKTPTDSEKEKSSAESVKAGAVDKDFKVGFIFLHDENSTYDKNFIDAANKVKEKLGLSDDQVLFKTNIPESAEAYDAAADLADRGADVIFADSFGHEPHLLQAASEFPKVQFCHASGTNAHTAGLDNFHNAFASIYEGRYLAGVVAGLKLNQMIEDGTISANEAKMGYVGAYTYAEVISGYTSFFLGARSVCPSVTMDVQFTGSWYDETAEKEAANMLIKNGAKLISQHADSMGAPTACEQAGVPNVSYNGSTIEACPNTYLISSKIDWEPYFEYMITQTMKGEKIDTDWSKGLAEGSVALSSLNEKAVAPGTQEKLNEVEKKLISGELHVFDTSTFTVDGKNLDSYKADVDTDEAYEKDTEVISGGYFHESEYRSAPYFDLRIDGITTLNEKM